MDTKIKIIIKKKQFFFLSEQEYLINFGKI